MLLRANSLDDTHAVAAGVARLSRAGDIIVLAGEMGAGKTAFAQGFGRELGVVDVITSPTFTLVHSYPCPGGRLTLHHADIYRLDRTGDVDELALHELAEFGGIVLVEWGDVAAAGLGDHLEVRLGIDDPSDDDQSDSDASDDASDDGPSDEFGLDAGRSIELHASGASWAGRWDRLASELAAYRC
jgi:tRNA threonylcarbamoyladenosine biosynthesis protein TsaE